MTEHERWMSLALREALKAHEQNEVPVGAVVVHRNQTVVGRGFNQVEMMKDATAHAEMIAITSAQATLESKWLKDCTLYVTMEPCPMCAGAMVLARLPILVFGCYDPKMGAAGSLYTIPEDRRLNHRIHVVPGVRDEECGSLLKDFFRRRRED